MIECPNEDCEGHIELSTKIYFTLTDGRFDMLPDPFDGKTVNTVVVENMEPYHGNDHVNMGGVLVPFNHEGDELVISCDHCGEGFPHVWGDAIVRAMDRQSDRQANDWTPLPTERLDVALGEDGQ